MKPSKTFITLLFLVLSVGLVTAQKYKFLPSKLHKLSGQELKGKGLAFTLDAFDQEGKKLDQIQRMQYSSSPKYVMEVYGNKRGVPQAVVFRASNEEEYDRKLNAFMKRDNTGDWKDTEAPSFAVMDMQGNGLNLSELKGKIIALNFWFIGCKPCIVEMPELNEMVEKYKEEDVVFVAVALDEKTKLEPFLQRIPFHYDIVPEGERIAQLYNVVGYPTHFLIDKEGKVQFFNRGYNGALVSILDKRIEGLLQK